MITTIGYWYNINGTWIVLRNYDYMTTTSYTYGIR